MTFTSYATATDLTDDNWIPGAAPDNVDSLLRAATFAVALACFRNPYSDVPTGNDAEALRDATCAQVASWISLGIDPAKAGTDTPAPVKKSSILTGDVERDTSAQAQAAVDAAKDLCCESVDILTVAGLIYMPVPQGASQFDRLPSWGQGMQRSPFRDPLSGEFEWPYGTSWPFV